MTSDATTATAAEASGTVRTTGKRLQVRAAPGTGYTSFSSLGNGDRVKILCQTEGQEIDGPYGTSRIWDMLSSGGFVSDAYVRTGSDGYVTDKCDYVGQPKRANPRSVNAAIAWQFARLGSDDYEGMCLNFQARSYGWSHAGVETAEIAGDWMESHGYLKKGVPPRGALVWYHNASGTGHIVVSLGEGKVIGTSVADRVGVGEYRYGSYVYRGWSAPYFPKAG